MFSRIPIPKNIHFLGFHSPKIAIFGDLPLVNNFKICYNYVMKIKRDIEKDIKKKLGQGKAIVIYGARQVGKTTLLKSIFGEPDANPNVLWLNGDSDITKGQLSIASAEAFQPLVEGRKVVIIDEAQRIENIGLKLKIMQDNFGDKIQFIATGSSSFDLANKINEPMTGRKWTFWLPAPSVSELKKTTNFIKEFANLDNRLLYGSYPAVVMNETSSREIITELAGDNLYKDILYSGEIIKTDKLRMILKALALQVGSQVSLTEVGSLVGVDRKTVDKYISLLEQSFVIFRLPSFSRNLRNELKFSQKVYFYDTGIRNAIINDFRPIVDRQDVGQIFENYVISELKKKYPKDNIYFWRTTDQQEVDFILERDGEITAFEVKTTKKAKMPNAFVNEYHPKNAEIITRENYLEVLAS